MIIATCLGVGRPVARCWSLVAGSAAVLPFAPFVVTGAFFVAVDLPRILNLGFVPLERLRGESRALALADDASTTTV
jgi:hypothetical protein